MKQLIEVIFHDMCNNKVALISLIAYYSNADNIYLAVAGKNVGTGTSEHGCSVTKMLEEVIYPILISPTKGNSGECIVSPWISSFKNIISASKI